MAALFKKCLPVQCSQPVCRSLAVSVSQVFPTSIFQHFLFPFASCEPFYRLTCVQFCSSRASVVLPPVVCEHCRRNAVHAFLDSR
jgi:hypothetical protein